jgi:hypothetical protein
MRRNLQVIDVDRPLCWLLGGAAQGYADQYRQASEAKIPYRDHVRCFINHDTGQRLLTIQPYVTPAEQMFPLELLDKVERTKRIIEDSKKFAQEWGLKVEFRDSWYDPNRCVLVEYSKKDS